MTDLGLIFVLAALMASSEITKVQELSPIGHWTPTENMTIPRHDHTATLLMDGTILIIGPFTNIAEIYDPLSGTFSPTGNTIAVHGQGATATLLTFPQYPSVINCSQIFFKLVLLDPGVRI